MSVGASASRVHIVAGLLVLAGSEGGFQRSGSSASSQYSAS